MQQSYLSVAIQTSSPRGGGGKLRNFSVMFPGASKLGVSSAIEYNLMLEFKRKKTVFKLYDLEVTAHLAHTTHFHTHFHTFPIPHTIFVGAIT